MSWFQLHMRLSWIDGVISRNIYFVMRGSWSDATSICNRKGHNNTSLLVGTSWWFYISIRLLCVVKGKEVYQITAQRQEETSEKIQTKFVAKCLITSLQKKVFISHTQSLSPPTLSSTQWTLDGDRDRRIGMVEEAVWLPDVSTHERMRSAIGRRSSRWCGGLIASGEYVLGLVWSESVGSLSVTKNSGATLTRKP
jgi:hypothetical protein